MFDIYGEPGYKLIFADSIQYCKQWYSVYSQNQYLTEALGSWVALTNIMFTVIFKRMEKRKREPNQAEIDKATTFNIFIAMYLNTAGLILLAHN